VTDSMARNRLQAALSSWPDWGLDLRQGPRLIEPVPGGRTNLNFRLEAPGLGADLLLRLNHPEPARLGIDRSLEREIAGATADAGIGRPVLYWDPGHRFAVSEYLIARRWTAADFADPYQIGRLWPLVEQLREIDIGLPRRRYADYVRHYWHQLVACDAIDAWLEARWRAFEPEVEAFDRSGWQAGLVHHDLIPSNVLDTGDRLVLIDWEYAAAGHPDIDRWSIQPDSIGEPFIADLMTWINDLWERLAPA